MNDEQKIAEVKAALTDTQYMFNLTHRTRVDNDFEIVCRQCGASFWVHKSELADEMSCVYRYCAAMGWVA